MRAQSGEYDIENLTIKYFTANVKRRFPNDPSKARRQAQYIRCLKSENVKVYYGKFVRRDKRGWEEKRTDVNLASHFLNDAWKDDYDYAAILSNDTDFCGVSQMVLNQFKDKPKKVAVWTFSPEGTAKDFPKKVISYRITMDDWNNNYTESVRSIK